MPVERSEGVELASTSSLMLAKRIRLVVPCPDRANVDRKQRQPTTPRADGKRTVMPATCSGSRRSDAAPPHHSGDGSDRQVCPGATTAAANDRG